MRFHDYDEKELFSARTFSILRFPFTGFEANQAWLQVVCWASDLVVWFQLLCLTGELANARPKRLRWSIWHTRHGSFAAAVETSSASSTAGPPPQTSSPATPELGVPHHRPNPGDSTRMPKRPDHVNSDRLDIPKGGATHVKYPKRSFMPNKSLPPRSLE